LTIFLLNLAGGLLLLYLGGEGIVRGSASLGLRLGMTPLLTGLTIVAFGTSAPELMVSLQAALSGQSSLAVGNVVGSNICNIALILGIATLVRPIHVDARLVRHDVPIMLACTVLLILLLSDGVISRLEGAFLVAALLAFIVYTARDSRSAKRQVRAEFRKAVIDGHRPLPLAILMALLGLAGLLLGGRLFVSGAIDISHVLGISPAVIGLSVAAVGTSLPELATSVVAAARGYGDMAAGNVVGSNIFNTLTVLGVTGSITPLDSHGVTAVDLGVMLVASLLSLRLLSTRSLMERWEGGALVAGFLAYMVWLFV
jgi:cation:H+ antiporter